MEQNGSKNENILCRLRIELEAEELDFRKSSLMQGVLFEKMSQEYAEEMHFQQLHPYSQCLVRENGKPIWYINTLSRKAYENIIVPMMDEKYDCFYIKHGDKCVKIRSKDCTIKPYSELIDRFYSGDKVKYIKLKLLTLTSFRQRGRYNILPNMRLVYQSLMMRYSSVAENSNMVDEETLEQLEENSVITGYRLHTGLFPLEGQNIPGYKGEITVKLNGTETMGRYARMLFQFGEYSGLGVKTGMGMGSMRTI